MKRSTRVLVTGAGGQVGVDLVDVLRGRTPLGGDATFQPDGRTIGSDEFEVRGLTRHDLDVTDRDAVTSTLQRMRPDVIVHLAAYTAVDRAEDDAVACFRVNAQGTQTMSLGAREVNAHLITISSDYVFDGRKGSAYVEEDSTNPLSVYGASKREGELLTSSCDTLVRTSWVVGVRASNVVHVIAERARGGAQVRFVVDQMGTATAASDLARSLATLVRERPGGTWHVANTGRVTWFEIAEYVGELLGRDGRFATPISTSELTPPPRAVRPRRSDLDTSKFSNTWLALPAWSDAVRRLVLDRATFDSETR